MSDKSLLAAATTTTTVVAVVTILLLLAVTTSPPVNATTTTSALPYQGDSTVIPLQNETIPDDVERVIGQIVELCAKNFFIPDQCMTVVHASNETVAIEGDLLVRVQLANETSGREEGYYENNAIWYAVDQLKQIGYNLHSISITGEGIELNPYELRIVLEKS